MAFQMGQPGVSAFLQSLIRDLDVLIEMGDYHFFLPTNTELKEIKNLLLRFEDVLLDGERKRQHGDKGTNRWMDELKDSLYDMDDLLDEIKMEKQQLQHEIAGQASNNKVRYNFQKGFNTCTDIKNRLVQVVGILGKHSEEADRLKLERDAVKHDAIWLESQAKIREKPGCFADEPRVYGREEDKNEVIKLLLEKDGKRKYEVVCVVGMGGMGKTTLAQLVFHDERIKNFFAARSWACISDVFDVINVIQNLIESAAENAEKADHGTANMPSTLPATLPALQARLQKIIKDQKFLLVLDDVWTANVLKELIGPLNYGTKGSMILVTTRLRKVAEDLGNKQPYELGRLEDAECLRIFNDNAFEAFEEGDEIDNDVDLMEIGEEIVKKCKGVPLVAKVIGSLLIGEDEGKWKAVKDNDLWDLAFKDEDLHPGLRLSYFYLPPFLKRCFEYLALFPSDFFFDEGELVRMWMAEGLIEVKDGTQPEEIGNQYYNDLKGRSLIQKDNKMHDMVHHLACIVSGRSFFRGSITSSSSTSSLQSVRHAYILDKPEVVIDANKLRTLVHKGDSVHESFSCKRLRVVKLSKVSYKQSCLGCDLRHLRYLKLEGNFENSILSYSLCELTNLQVLDLSRFSNLNNLPQDIGMLSSLRYLRLEHTGITGLPDSVCSLSNLRVLDISFSKYLTALPKDIGNLRTLHELLLYDTAVSSFPESILYATNLRVLQTSNSATLPAHIGKLTKLEELSCYGVGKEKGRGIDELKGMNKLKGWLTIENMENIDSAEEVVMANLRSKKHIEGLEFIWKDYDAFLEGRDGEMEVRVMEALEPNAAIKYLTFRNYVGHKFPSWMSTAPLHNLTCLSLSNLPAATELTGMEFMSLKILELYNCPALREIQMTTPKLERLTVEQCKELKRAKLILFPLLSDALETLECEYCHLDYFVRQLKSTNASPCTKLKMLKVWVGEDKGITSLPLGWPSILTSLEYLTLEDLPPTNFQIVSEEDESCCVAPSKLLVSIKQLYIRYCRGLVSLESLELPSRLKYLEIRDCPNLRNLPYGLRDLTSLEGIQFWDCPVLEIRPHDPLPPSVTCHKLITRCPKLKVQWMMEESDQEWKGAFGLIGATCF